MIRKLRHLLLSILLGSASLGCDRGEPVDPDREDWVSLFNGRDLNRWVVKIAGHDPGVNFANTFLVEDGLLQVRYDGYGKFDDQFGHIFYDEPFSHYRIVIEYRFVGDQQEGGPGWATRNSGVMLHSQNPRTMPREQDFPISVETQFLGGLSDQANRPTGQVCTPGTEIVIDGAKAPRHCMPSTARTYDGDQWVRAEVLVLGDSLVRHMINGDTVLTYHNLTVGGGAVSGHDPAMKTDGAALSSGYIALQSESHPIDFRRVELLNLRGCTDKSSRNYKRYFVESDPKACE